MLNQALKTGKAVSLFLQRYNLLLENITLFKLCRKKKICTFFSIAWEIWVMPPSSLCSPPTFKQHKRGYVNEKIIREKYSFLHLKLLEKSPCLQNCWCMLFWTDTMCQLHGTSGNAYDTNTVEIFSNSIT